MKDANSQCVLSKTFWSRSKIFFNLVLACFDCGPVASLSVPVSDHCAWSVRQCMQLCSAGCPLVSINPLRVCFATKPLDASSGVLEPKISFLKYLTIH